MKKQFILRFDLLLGSFYYCYDAKLGAYLSKSIYNARCFDSFQSINSQVHGLMRYFFDYPVEFTILHN